MGAVVEDSPLYFPTISRWRAWLRRNPARPGGSWVLIAKKGTRPGISYREALDEALCWGWIDGKLHRHDERRFAQWFSPRRVRSIWSLANRNSVERLAAEGRMQPAGLAMAADAKANGQWDRAYSSRAMPRMSLEVRRRLVETGAWEAWRKLAPSRRLQLLYWIGDAKRPETRVRRISELPVLVRENRLAGFSA